ncbi:MAG: hypothetical protein HY465_04220 [Deltaproteobacteria bacterium]|nr:hypothetical protein [Deltaproteobacteria bacterium]
MAVEQLQSGISLPSGGMFFAADTLVCDEAYGEDLVDARTLGELHGTLARLEAGQSRAQHEVGKTQYAIDRATLPAIFIETMAPGTSLILDDQRLPLLDRREAIQRDLTRHQKQIAHVQGEIATITRKRADHEAGRLLATFGHNGNPQDYLYFSGLDELPAEEMAMLGSLYADFGIHDVASQYFVVASELADDTRQSDLMLTAAYRTAPKKSPLLAGDRDELSRTLHQLGERIGSHQSGDRARFLSARFHALRESLDPAEFSGDDPLEIEIILIDRAMPPHIGRRQTFDDVGAWADLTQEVNDYEIALKSLPSRRHGIEAAESLRQKFRERVDLVAQMALPFATTMIADERGEPEVSLPNPWGRELAERLVGMSAQVEVTSRLLSGEAIDAITRFRELKILLPASPTLAAYERSMTARYPALDRGDGHFINQFDRDDDAAVVSLLPSYLGTQSIVEDIGIPLGGAGLGAALLCFAAGTPSLAACGGIATVGGMIGAGGGIAFNHWKDYRDAQDVLDQASRSGFSPVFYDDAVRQWGIQGAGDGVSAAMVGFAGPSVTRVLRTTGRFLLGNGANGSIPISIAPDAVEEVLNQIPRWGGWEAYYASRISGAPVFLNRSSSFYRFWGGNALWAAGLGYAGYDLATLPDGSIGWDGIHSWKGVAGTTFGLARLGRPMIRFETIGAGLGAGVSVAVQASLMLLAGASSSTDMNKNAVITAGVIPYGMVVFMGQWSVYGAPFLRSNWVGTRLLSLNEAVGGGPGRALAALTPPIVRRPGALTGFVDNNWRRIALTADGARALANVNATTNAIFTGLTADVQGIDRQNGLLSRVPKQWLFHRFLGRRQLYYGYATTPGQLLARGGGGGMEVAIGSFANPHSRKGRNLPGVDRRLDGYREYKYDPIAIAASSLRRQDPTGDYDYELLQRIQDGVVSYGPLNAAVSSMKYGGVQWESIDYKSLAGHMQYFENASAKHRQRLARETERLKQAVASGRIADPLDVHTVIAMDLMRRAAYGSRTERNGTGLELAIGVKKGIELADLVDEINRGERDRSLREPPHDHHQ